MDLQLRDKLVVVTGGAKGIGEAITRALAAEGAIPVIIGRNNKDNRNLASDIEVHGGKVFHEVAELTDPGQCEDVINKIAGLHGRIDGLVNNAGINDGVGLETGDYDSFVASLHRNLIHYFMVTKTALPFLKESNGSIVNISSKTAETGQGNTSGYAASNGGRNALTREWAVELLPFQVRVNAVIVAESFTPLYKKWIDTLPDPGGKLKEIESKIPLGKRMTTPKEIADMVAFLLSPRSSHTTGQLIHVDGGYVHLDRVI